MLPLNHNDALEEMKNGHIHNTLIRVLGKFLSAGFTEEDTYKLLYPHALEEGKPFEGLKEKIDEIHNMFFDGAEAHTQEKINETPSLQRELY